MVPQSPSNISELIASHKNPKWWTGLWNTEEFDRYEKFAWFQKNSMLGFYWAAIYVVVIFSLKEWMKGRKAFDLKIPLILWNFSLAIFSIRGAIFMLSEMYHFLTTKGAHLSMCGTVDLVSHLGSYWTIIFVYSKIIEFGDTIFIILRKRPLIFLHWYHHISVLIVGWYFAKELAAPGVWVCVVNCSVHAVMYSYFTLTAMGDKIPKRIAMAITSTQLTQFVFMLGVMAYTFYAKFWGTGCEVTGTIVVMSFCLGFSYLFLFGQFFYNAYVNKNKGKKIE